MWPNLQKTFTEEILGEKTFIFCAVDYAYIVGIGVSTPSKTQPFLSCQAPLKSTNCPSPPLFRQSPLYIVSSRPPPPKVGSFSEPLSSLIPSYLLKVTKFLVKISQFEFLVTTEQSILVCKLFLSLNFPDFIYFLSKNCTPPCKKLHPISQ